ncbi:MAG: reactive intermediate/imine deaminase [Candidatus Eisenbacteria bacterium]|nr:reactive intermediate/imine deaminase [Candidatus Eisenbacteria bacterium]
MERREIRTGEAPAAVGPYSQAIRTGPFVHTAGQIALDPGGGGLAGGTAGEQAERVLRNLRAVLDAAGSSMDRVVKTTVYLTDLNAFHEVNEIYARFFPDPAPARSCVEVRALPKGALVMIDAIGLAADEG